jgi:hypothetical protein
MADQLRRAEDIDTFVETGTYLGASIAWASENFRRVWTIEISETYLASAQARHADLEHVNYVLGDSATEIAKVCASLPGPALFWLDAHAGAGFFAPEDNCPLLAEVEAVVQSAYDHCIFIDDARAFLAPPPPPFNYRTWPTLEQILAAIARKPGDYHVVAICDALIAVPGRRRDLVAQFCFEVRPQI